MASNQASTSLPYSSTHCSTRCAKYRLHRANPCPNIKVNILFCWSNMAKLPWNLFKIFEVGSSSRCSRPCCFRKNSEVKSCCSTSMIKRWYCSMVSCTLEILEEKSMILLKYLPTIRFPKTYQITTRDQGIHSINAAVNNIREIPAKQ